MFQLATNNAGQLTQNFVTLTPAYGRDYKKKADAIADFEANKDFVLQPHGQYINKEQIAEGVTVNIRYNKQRSITTHKVKH